MLRDYCYAEAIRIFKQKAIENNETVVKEEEEPLCCAGHQYKRFPGNN